MFRSLYDRPSLPLFRLQQANAIFGFTAKSESYILCEKTCEQLLKKNTRQGKLSITRDDREAAEFARTITTL